MSSLMKGWLTASTHQEKKGTVPLRKGDSPLFFLMALPVAVATVALVILASGGLVATASSSDDQPETRTQSINKLTPAEKQAGWKLLFDGKSFDGWHSFKHKEVRPGWQVKDGTLACVNPEEAGDLVTADQYDWFDLRIDYNISEGGNSGIMFHVTNDGRATWATGPEVQLEDNAKAGDPIRCGWLYQLYKPPTDPRTRKPLDTTKPAGQWNHMRIVIAQPPAKSEVDVNGVKYYDFVYNSDDFKARVARSKFRRRRHFAKSDTGFIALQGDHGVVSFRNIKLRPLTAKGER